MRLLRLEARDELVLTDDLTHNTPPYAILSHTWGEPGDEVLLQDIRSKDLQQRYLIDDEVREKRGVLSMLLEDYLRCSGGLAKQATGRKPVVWALCTHRPGGASIFPTKTWLS
jgi:hypothetical protein